MTITATLDREAAAGGALTMLTNGRHAWQADLSRDVGGQDTAPQPHDLLDSALAACTTLTLELYIQRKALPVTRPHVSVDRTEGKSDDGRVDYRLSRRIEVAGTLDDAQRQQLLAIANRCPIHRVLEGHVAVRTSIK